MILTVPLECFCWNYAEHGNAKSAHRAYVMAGGQTIGEPRDPLKHVAKILERYDVQDRIMEIRSQWRAAIPTTWTPHEALKVFVTKAKFDMRELVEHRRGACRHCWSVGHAYHWTPYEYREECKRVEKRNRMAKPELREPYPDLTGGIDYDGTREPNASCPECFGEGIGRVYMHDTSTLSEAARLCYRGAKVSKNGIEMIIDDPGKAAEAATRIIGAFKDALTIDTGAAGELASRVLKAVDAQEAARAYADFMARAVDATPGSPDKG